MRINPLNCIDFYKADHRRQYPEGTTKVYSNFTPRSARLANLGDNYDDKVVFFGLQGFVQWFLKETWTMEFFAKPKERVVREYKRRMDTSLGPGAIDTKHIEDLHDLGYLPIRIKAVPEGSRVNIKVPVLTIENTLPEFFWLTNYLESVLSAELWKPTTNATIAYEYKKLLTKAAEETGAPIEFVPIQGHDFSFRGLSGVHDAASSGAGHLLSFVGTDTVPAIDYLEDYYYADADNELIGCSVPATEHSVMCMGTKDSEIDTFRRLITALYPSGVVSIVSDTWDFWRVITEYAAELKPEILAREKNALGLAKTVFRPDSGDPVRVICGYTDDEVYVDNNGHIFAIEDHRPLSEAEFKGAVKCLWDIFGGTETEKGYKVLDEHVGLIYGDSITLDRATRILEGMKAKGFASNNIVFGVGSFTYQYNTRDTFGFAMKATYGEVNGEGREIFKDPVTDGGTKKSARGKLSVLEKDGEYALFDQLTDHLDDCVLETVFKDGELVRKESLEEIRNRLNNS